MLLAFALARLPCRSASALPACVPEAGMPLRGLVGRAVRLRRGLVSPRSSRGSPCDLVSPASSCLLAPRALCRQRRMA
eukprot:6382568-Alexandrium_andersonii.AAC.1